MFILIDHEIKHARKFQERAEKAFYLPNGLHIHMLLPATDVSRAACLYEEADSVESVKTVVDDLLGDASVNSYVAVAEDQAMGLPRNQAA